MKIPRIFRNMNLVKCYKDYALYENEYYKECFSYFELGIIRQAKNYQRERKIGSGYDNKKQELIHKQINSMIKEEYI